MKRTLLSLLVLLVALTGRAQTIGEAFYVYRNDGEFNAFLREEVDSIAYSCYDADSLYYGEIVTQVVYTADSTYWIPLASIDSVSFVTPETKYTPQVVKLEPLLPYIVSVDGMKLTFSSDIPSNLFPRMEDILVLDNFDHEQFPTGFAGRMSSREGMQIVCDSVSFEDIYEQIICYGYYTAINDDTSTENNHVRLAAKKKVGGDISTSISVNGTLGARETGIFASVDGSLGLDLRFTFKHKKGEPTYFDHSLTPELAVNLEAGAEGTISKTIESKVPLLLMPIPNTPFYLKMMGGPVLELSLSASVTAKTEAKLGYKFGVKYANEEFKWDGGNTLKWFSRPNVTGSISGNIFIGLKEEFGISSYGDIVSTAIEKKAGAEIEANISEDIMNSDNYSYDNLRDAYLDVNLKASAAFKAEAKLFRWFKLSAKYEIYSGKLNIYKFRLVPSFAEPNVYPRYSSENSYVVATLVPEDDMIFGVSLGLGLWDGSNSFLDAQFCQSEYYDRKSWPIAEYSTTFQHLPPNRDYTIRPLIKLFGGMIVAPQEVNFKGPEIKPYTQAVSNVGNTTAVANGRIKGHELLDETMKYGLAYVEVGRTDTIWCDATSIGADGFFSVDFTDLKPNTTYRFFAYLIIGGERYEGTKRMFTTEEIVREAYYVWDEANKTATFYYDDKCSSRGGRSSNRLPYSQDRRVERVIFDSSFSRYYPESFGFSNYNSLQHIDHLNYLNTDSITNMEYMFNNCSSLTILDVSHFNTSNVTMMTSMFQGCNSLTSLDLSNFDTSCVSTMGSMFKDCSSLVSLDLSSFNTSNVTEMYNMFNSCGSLVTLDLSSFRFNANSVNIAGMFGHCTSLSTIYAGNWPCTYWCDPAPFSGCPNLRGGMGTRVGENIYGQDENGYPLSYYCYASHAALAHIDGGKDNPGLFTEK